MKGENHGTILTAAANRFTNMQTFTFDCEKQLDRRAPGGNLWNVLEDTGQAAAASTLPGGSIRVKPGGRQKVRRRNLLQLKSTLTDAAPKHVQAAVSCTLFNMREG